jgi:hypothetical protein
MKYCRVSLSIFILRLNHNGPREARSDETNTEGTAALSSIERTRRVRPSDQKARL